MIKYTPKECLYGNCADKAIAKGFCGYHQDERTDSQYLRSKAKREGKEKKKLTFKKNDTGEGIFLVAYLNTHEHIDFVTGEYIDDATVYNTHHVLPKSHYGLWRTNDRNIVLLSNDNHNFAHTMAESDLTDPDTSENFEGWLRYFKLKEELKSEYEKIYK